MITYTQIFLALLGIIISAFLTYGIGILLDNYKIKKLNKNYNPENDAGTKEFRAKLRSDIKSD